MDYNILPNNCLFNNCTRFKLNCIGWRSVVVRKLTVLLKLQSAPPKSNYVLRYKTFYRFKNSAETEFIRDAATKDTEHLIVKVMQGA